ncbi:MAG: acyl-CoA thioesterase [Bacteroidota bacterium]
MERTNLKPKKVNDSRTIMTEMVMPNDTNPSGNLMGGNLMRWMDIVASVAAGKHCESEVVTASVDHVSFTKPIFQGDIVTLESQVTRTFNSSLEVYVEVFAANMKGGNNRMCNHAYFTFVALTDDLKDTLQVPEVIPLTREEEKLYEGAERRRELRLILSGRMKPEEATKVKAFFNSLG